MKEPNNLRNRPVVAVAGVAAVILTVGGGVAWWTASQNSPADLLAPPESPADFLLKPIPPESPQSIPAPVPQTTPEAPPPQAIPPEVIQSPSPDPETSAVQPSVDIYWLQDDNGQMQLAARPIPLKPNTDPTVALETAFNALLTNASTPAQTSEIPPNTRLLSLKTQGNEVYVDLSPEFTQGGGSASMMGRLGQVVYTATSLNPEAKVWISVAGQPLERLGGEGLEVPQPTTRTNFSTEFQLE
ncbi:MAG: hypothetical protein HC835_00135 [Oscillatoriales cyanobacterium RM2_1_1]|nr:hypothetical protein [Oscillatoriales cyanobacterium SM2_3_0]NJO44162.1 hypothetical protein [Oscillatoriales cyanobacterium RM2_1_1]